MTDKELIQVFKQFQTVTKRLEESLEFDTTKNSVYRDASIQRFEFCFDLCWKLLKRVLRSKGIDAKNPRDVFRMSFQQGWLVEGDDFWSEMIEDRNLTSHTYHEPTAIEVHADLPKYLEAFRRLAKALEKKEKARTEAGKTSTT